MFSHRQVWGAIDALARTNGMSVSRLARTAGLDPTTFNKSKRQSNDGRLRWPSTESLAKIMDATNTHVQSLTALIADGEMAERGAGPIYGFGSEAGVSAGIAGFGERAAPAYIAPPSLPLLGMAQAGSGGFFDDAGFPSGEGWDEVEFPFSAGEPAYALEVSGDSMMPLYRDGDRIVVSPTAQVRRGDRVVVRTREGEVLAKVLSRKTARRIELASLNPAHEDRGFDLTDVEWMARIMWASQ